MPDQKISADTLTPPADTGFFPWVTSGLLNVRATFAQLAAYMKTALGGYFSGGGSNFVSNAWYYLHPVPSVSAGAVWSGAGQIAFSPIVVSAPLTFKALAIKVTTLFAGGNVAVAIYANSSTTNKPTGLPLASVTGLSTSAATNVSATLGAPVTLQPGIYWAAVQMDNTTAVLSTPSTGAAGSLAALVGGTLGEVAISASAVGVQYYPITGTYPVLPDVTAQSWPAGSNGNRYGSVFLQAN